MTDRVEAGRFAPGHAGGPGRPKGSRNKLAESFLEALNKDFEANGLQAIQEARAADPLGYVKVVAGLLPQKVEIDRDVDSMTDEELLAIARRGRSDGPAPQAHPPGSDDLVH